MNQANYLCALLPAGKQALSYYFTDELHEFLEAVLGWYNAHDRADITPVLKKHEERLEARVQVGLRAIFSSQFRTAKLTWTPNHVGHHSTPISALLGRGNNGIIVRKKNKRNGRRDTTSEPPSLVTVSTRL